MENNTPSLRTPAEALQAAIDFSGGVSALAALLRTGQSTVSNWVMRGRVPANRCRDIQAVTGERVTCHELRPDIFPAIQKAA